MHIESEKKHVSSKTAPLVIAGTASGVGKTTVSVGLMGALGRRGMRVAPFKVGPDYIDPGFHHAVTGAASRNLDTWLTPPATARDIYNRGAEAADIAVIEGVMGLFDGRAGARGAGSTAEIARLVGGTVVLVVDCARMARSLAPLLSGFAGFDDRLRIAGVVLNNVGGASHAHMLNDAAAEAGVPVLGVLPRRPDISLPSRHLGLVPAGEKDGLDESLERLIDHVEGNLDLDALVSLGGAACRTQKAKAAHRSGDKKKHAADTSARNDTALAFKRDGHDPKITSSAVRLAVARDEAFSFYYVDSLEALEAAGAELVYFSPLRDSEPPACDGIYLGGGFPEMFASRLEANASMRRSLATAAGEGLPVYAECGGLIYLCRSVEVDGNVREMAGVVPATARMSGSRQAMGYVEARARRDNLLLARGESIRGHEFHWSTVAWPQGEAAYECFSTRDRSGGPRSDGFAGGSLLASFVHVHFAGSPEAAERFISACARAKGVVTGAAK